MIISDTSHLGNDDLEVLGMRENVSSRREKCTLHTRTISQSVPIVANAPARRRFRSRSAIEQWILQKLRANRALTIGPVGPRQTLFVRGANCSRDEKTEHNTRARRAKRRTMIFRYIRTDVHKSRRYDIGQSSPMRSSTTALKYRQPAYRRLTSRRR